VSVSQVINESGLSMPGRVVGVGEGGRGGRVAAGPTWRGMLWRRPGLKGGGGERKQVGIGNGRGVFAPPPKIRAPLQLGNPALVLTELWLGFINGDAT